MVKNTFIVLFSVLMFIQEFLINIFIDLGYLCDYSHIIYCYIDGKPYTIPEYVQYYKQQNFFRQFKLDIYFNDEERIVQKLCIIGTIFGFIYIIKNLMHLNKNVQNRIN